MYKIPLVVLCGGRSARFSKDGIRKNKALINSCIFTNSNSYLSLALFQALRFKKHFKNIYLCFRDNKALKKDLDSLKKNNFNLKSKNINFLNLKGIKIIDELKILKQNAKSLNIFNQECFLDYQNKEAFSPLFGIFASLQMLQKESIFISVDTPFISFASLKKLADSKNNAFLKDESRSHFIISKWNKESINMLREKICKKNFKLSYVLEHFLSIDIKNKNEFININTQDDYLALKNAIIKD